MMNEKRFVLCKKGDVEYIEDNGCVQLYGFDVLCEMLNEQEAIIRKLQDLCGKSDYENAKLREEVNLLRPTNIEQYEQIQKLQEENEQLLRCKYFVKAVEVFTDCPISETIADYSDGELFDEEEQLEFGKKMLEQEKELVEDE